MEIKDVLTLDCTSCAIQISSKKKILESIGRLAGERIGYIDTITVMRSIFDREKKGSTGIGHGIAIPHGRIVGLQKAVAVLVTTESPIQFDAIDNEPVDVFFALLVPAEDAASYLNILASVAEKLNNKTVIDSVRRASTRRALYEAIV